MLLSTELYICNSIKNYYDEKNKFSRFVRTFYGSFFG
jgi:hypothetical protein